jgi:integrase
MGGSDRAGVRKASGSTIEIDFYYRNRRCRERLKLEPTPRNLRWAESLLGKIRLEIGRGAFDYAATFPDSPRAREFAPAAAALDTIEQHLWAWLRRKEPTLELHTRKDYRKAINNVLVPAFGAMRLRDFTRRHAKDWIADRPDLTAKRLNNVLSPLRQMLAEAAEDEILDENPMAGVKVKRRTAVKAHDDIDPFTPAEVKLILRACDGQFRNMVATGVGSGLRWPSEIIALQWADVDLDAGTVRVRAAMVCRQRKGPKTAAGNRVVQLATIALDALRAQRAHTLLKGGAVFENPNTGEAWTSDQVVGQHWNPTLKRAGVRHRPGKQLRHTYASTMLSAGEPLRWVAFQLGHLDASVTARTYSRFIPSVLPDVGHKGEAAWR